MKYLITLSLAFCINTAWAEILTGRVVGVTDGDTITVLDGSNTQHKIRLGGIDAPEKKQAFGNASKKSLSDLVYDKRVDVDWYKHDRYGRIVGKVLVDGVDANLEQIKRGMAWYYKKYKGELVLEDRLSYLHAQEDAENNKLGLWSEIGPVAPWQYRSNQH